MDRKDTGREKGVGIARAVALGAREWLDTMPGPLSPRNHSPPHKHQAQYVLGVKYLMGPQEPGAPLPSARIC